MSYRGYNNRYRNNNNSNSGYRRNSGRNSNNNTSNRYNSYQTNRSNNYRTNNYNSNYNNNYNSNYNSNYSSNYNNNRYRNNNYNNNDNYNNYNGNSNYNNNRTVRRNNRTEGICKKWFNDRGYGFVRLPNGEFIYVHQTQLTKPLYFLFPGAHVTFYIKGTSDKYRKGNNVQFNQRIRCHSCQGMGHKSPDCKSQYNN